MENQPVQPPTPQTPTSQAYTAQPQPSPPEIPPISPIKKINKPLIIALVLLFLATTGVAGYFAYQNYQLKNQLRSDTSSIPVKNIESTTPVPSETSEKVADKTGEEIIDVNLMVHVDGTVTEVTPITLTTGRPTSPSIINQKKGDYSLKVGNQADQSPSETILWSCSFPIYFDYTGPVFEDVDYSEVKNDAVYVSYRIPYEPEMKSVQLWHKEKLIFFKRLPEN